MDRLRGGLLAFAAFQVALGLAATVVLSSAGVEKPEGLPLWVFPLQMLAFGGVAVAVLRGGRGDPRTADLAALFLLVASSFSRAPNRLFQAEVYSSLLLALLSVRLDALQPFALWSFFSRFPRAVETRRMRLAARGMTLASAAVGLAIVAANLAAVLVPGTPALEPLFPDGEPTALALGIVYALALPAAPFVLWKLRGASAEERGRARLFAAGLAAAVAIFSLFSLAQVVSPVVADWIRGPGRPIALTAIELVIVSVPLTTAYAVLVDRVLPVRAVLRTALRYGLAHAVMAAVVALPFVWLGFYLHALRDRPLAELATAPRLALLAGAGSLAFVAFRARRLGRDAIDRAFFREGYDARQILLAVAERSRRVASAAELAELLSGEIDRALHVERIAVLFAEPLAGELRARSGAVRALRLDSQLARLLGERGEPLPVELERGPDQLAELPEAERAWLVDAAAHLLVPITSSESELIGLLVLGERRSELPFSREDQHMLAAIAAAGAVALERRLRLGTVPGRATGERAAHADEAALECRACAGVQERGAERCADCGGALQPGLLPLVLYGKFRLERRIGEGGMGVVYRARDLELERDVAIKTLPATSPSDAARLRREARAMAAVRHPNLAVVYAAESWLGTPLLVTEFLAGGTLADRILPARLPLAEVAALGAALAAALQSVHRAGVLHRDVKPSNIGYSSDGEPKLLDFGLARVRGEARARASARPEAEGRPDRRTTLSEEGLVGTPLYMSPEAIRGETPDATFDLWALAVVLYEALAGRSPFECATWRETLDAIRGARSPDVREHAPELPAAVSDFLRDALDRSPGRRPATAAEFRSRWLAATRAASAAD